MTENYFLLEIFSVNLFSGLLPYEKIVDNFDASYEVCLNRYNNLLYGMQPCLLFIRNLSKKPQNKRRGLKFEKL